MTRVQTTLITTLAQGLSVLAAIRSRIDDMIDVKPLKQAVQMATWQQMAQFFLANEFVAE